MTRPYLTAALQRAQRSKDEAQAGVEPTLHLFGDDVLAIAQELVDSGGRGITPRDWPNSFAGLTLIVDPSARRLIP